jgi:hypothetical protein
MEKSPNRIDTAARLLVAMYVGALLAGPAPFGFFFISLPIGWIAAGVAAGRRFAPLGGLLAFLLMETPMVVPDILKSVVGIQPWSLLTVGLQFALTAAGMSWLAGWLASRSRVGAALDGWRGWRAAAVLVLLISVYTFTIGPSVAARTLPARFPKQFPAGSSRKIHACGVYIGIDGRTGGDFPDIYYTDPSGLVFLFTYSD